MTTVMIYVTAGSTAEAKKIARTIVEERLVACANVLPSISSVYWWQGKLQEDQEAALIVKTRQDLVDAVISRIKEIHSYDCPCIVAMAITSGNDDFLKWIISETS